MTIEYLAKNASAAALAIPEIVASKTSGQPTGIDQRPAAVLLAVDTDQIIGHEELMTMFDAMVAAVLDASTNPLVEGVA